MSDEKQRDSEALMLEVIDHLHRYAWAFERGDEGSIADLFSNDATVRFQVTGVESSTEHYSGRESVSRGLGEKRQSRPRWLTHQLTTPMFTALGPRSASLQVYLSIFEAEKRGGVPRIAVTGEYLVRMAHEENRWYIESLSIILDSEY